MSAGRALLAIAAAATALVVVTVASTVLLYRAGLSACERAYTTTIQAVPGVVKVTGKCTQSIEGSTQPFTVWLKADDTEDAYPVVEQILAELAGNPGLEDNWGTPNVYVLHDDQRPAPARDELHSLDPIGFNGSPTVGEARRHYAIRPH